VESTLAFPNISIEEARQQLQRQDEVLRSFPEVTSVLGKIGRADTPTDPAPLSMVETVVQLKPRSEWRTKYVRRWYVGSTPEFIRPLLNWLQPEFVPMTREDLVQEMNARRAPPPLLALRRSRSALWRTSASHLGLR
jgi:Cu(I)/Ag(I) efflux system membrane protein CusA/SilA